MKFLHYREIRIVTGRVLGAGLALVPLVGKSYRVVCCRQKMCPFALMPGRSPWETCWQWDILIQIAMDQNPVSALTALLRGLRPLQEKIVRLYFGMGCQRSHSAAEIAREFQVSSQVIGGILGGAQRRLAKVGWTPRKLAEAARRGRGSG